MNTKPWLGRFVFCISIFSTGDSLGAGWSWNLGYHNPPTSQFGLNFMYQWTQVAIELGVGQIQTTDQNSSSNNSGTKSLNVLGDVNLKYLFGSHWMKPYLQVGTLLGSSASSEQVSASTSQTFFGGGLFLSGNPFYFYVGANSIRSQWDAHLGLGFSF